MIACLNRNVQECHWQSAISVLNRGLVGFIIACSSVQTRMRTERNKDGTWNVWMTRDKYSELPGAADTFQQEIAFRLMGDCGLRVAEVLDVEPKHISRRSDGHNWELEVVAGKDTTGEYSGGKHRETWLPRDFEALINRYTQEKGIGDDERLVDKAKRTVQEAG